MKSDWKSGQWWGRTSVASSLMLGSILGPAFDHEPTMSPQTISEPWLSAADAGDFGYLSVGTGATASDVVLVGEGDYLSVAPRVDYQSITAESELFTTYTVVEGDTLWAIAGDHGTDLATLLLLNPEVRSELIHPGEVLRVSPGFSGEFHTVAAGESLEEIAVAYNLSAESVAEANRLALSDALYEGQLLRLPGGETSDARVMLASRSGGLRRVARVGLSWPIAGGSGSSEFGEPRGDYVHTGLDIAVPAGTPAVAAGLGTVVFAGWDGGYGYCLVIDHGNGVQTRYAHASELLVSEGQSVSQGEEVVLVGATGNSTGPHLHFEVLVNGTPENPRQHLP